MPAEEMVGSKMFEGKNFAVQLVKCVCNSVPTAFFKYNEEVRPKLFGTIIVVGRKSIPAPKMRSTKTEIKKNRNALPNGEKDCPTFVSASVGFVTG